MRDCPTEPCGTCGSGTTFSFILQPLLLAGPCCEGRRTDPDHVLPKTLQGAPALGPFLVVCCGKKCLSPSLWKRDQRKAGGGHNSQRASVSCAASLLPVRAEAEHFQAKCAKAPMTELGQHNKPSAPCLVRVNPTPCKQVEF